MKVLGIIGGMVMLESWATEVGEGDGGGRHEHVDGKLSYEQSFSNSESDGSCSYLGVLGDTSGRIDDHSDIDDDLQSEELARKVALLKAKPYRTRRVVGNRLKMKRAKYGQYLFKKRPIISSSVSSNKKKEKKIKSKDILRKALIIQISDNFPINLSSDSNELLFQGYPLDRTSVPFSNTIQEVDNSPQTRAGKKPSKVEDKKEDKVENLTEQLEMSVNAIEGTLKFVRSPYNLSGLGDLPEPNKAILLDLANMLVEEGKDEFSFIVNALQNQVLDNTLFDSSADMIKYGFQIEQDYKKYTQSGHPEFLQSLVNCFILCRGQELVGLLPIIDVECLKILVRSSIDHSGNTDCSAQLLKLARQLEHIIE